ncbi:MAG: amidohydrolase family protein [Acidimicrobiia bacterium]|nr:amidohydrolase family protein [Acidimicrobiia bacterium]
MRVPEGFLVADADTHCVEPRDAFTRHMDVGDRSRAVRVLSAEGRERVLVGDSPRPLEAPPFEVAVPEMRDRDLRIKAMDERGVDAALVLPTLGLDVEHEMRHDVAGTYANLRAFNTWLEEDWGYAWRERIFGVPLLSLLDVDLAVAELERLIAREVRALHLRCSPSRGRSIADPVFDPIWARIEEAGIAVVFHVCEAGYTELLSVAWGEDPYAGASSRSRFQSACFHGDRPMMDTIAAAVFGGLFARFPDVAWLSVGHGGGWVPYLLGRLDQVATTASPTGRRVELPSDVVRRHLHVAPGGGDDIADIVACLGVDRVLYGSGWFGHEGEMEPAGPGDFPPSMTEADVRAVAGDNLRRLLRLPVG